MRNTWKKAGRPSKRPSDRRRNPVRVLFNDLEYRRAWQCAKPLAVSEWIRQLVEDAIAKSEAETSEAVTK